MDPTEYRPRFVVWTSFVAQLPFHLFFSFWAGGFFGGFVKTLLPGPAEAMQRSIGSPFLVVGLGVLVLFPVVTLSVKCLNYRNTVYRLHADRLELEEGFLTQRRKEIRLSSALEVSLQRGILQRLVGLGSVYVATLATGQGQRWQPWALLGATSMLGSGAMLMDLAAPEDAYRRLRNLMDAARSPAA